MKFKIIKYYVTRRISPLNIAHSVSCHSVLFNNLEDAYGNYKETIKRENYIAYLYLMEGNKGHLLATNYK